MTQSGYKRGTLSPKYEGTWSESSVFSAPTITAGIAHTGKKDAKGIAFVKCLLWVELYIYYLI